MKEIKILFTSIGRRVELVQEFKKAAETLNIRLTIYGADYTDTAPALCFCDKKIKICKINDREYIPTLLKICTKEKIDGLIPTIDTDLLVLAHHKRDFENLGTKVFISDEDKIKICRDKTATAAFFEKLGLKSPTPVDNYKEYRGTFPAFIKPKDGSSSVNAYKVNDASELETYSKEVPDYIIAPFVDGVEYTIDAFCDYSGNPVFITPRIRLSIRAGEVLKTKIVQDKKIIKQTKTIINAFKPCGAITIQLIRQNNTGDDYFIEINPRFGGGAPLSMKAGANSAIALLKILANETLTYQNNAADDGAVYCRFDQSVRIK